MAGHAGIPDHFLAHLRHAAQGVLVHLLQLLQAGFHALVHTGDQLQLGFAVVRGDMRVGQRRAQSDRVRRKRQRARRQYAQTFFFNTAAYASKAFCCGKGEWFGR